MKKIYLSFIFSGTLAMVSCGGSENEFSTSASYPAMNLVTSIETGESFATRSLYNFYFTTNNSQATIGTSNLTINNQTYSFNSEMTTYQAYFYQGAGEVDILKKPLGTVRSSSGGTYDLESSDQAIISTINYWNTDVPGESNPVYGSPAIVYQYNIGNLYNIKTFQGDALYVGKTTTSYSSGGENIEYINENMTYRIRMNFDKNTADVIIYRAKFAEAMPMELTSIVVPGLNIEWLSGTYKITGKDIVPLVYENNNPVEYPAFTFNSIEFNPSNATLTRGELSYEVAGRYFGSFSGAYLNEPYNNMN